MKLPWAMIFPGDRSAGVAVLYRRHKFQRGISGFWFQGQKEDRAEALGLIWPRQRQFFGGGDKRILWFGSILLGPVCFHHGWQVASFVCARPYLPHRKSSPMAP